MIFFSQWQLGTICKAHKALNFDNSSCTSQYQQLQPAYVTVTSHPPIQFVSHCTTGRKSIRPDNLSPFHIRYSSSVFFLYLFFIHSQLEWHWNTTCKVNWFKEKAWRHFWLVFLFYAQGTDIRGTSNIHSLTFISFLCRTLAAKRI